MGIVMDGKLGISPMDCGVIVVSPCGHIKMLAGDEENDNSAHWQSCAYIRLIYVNAAHVRECRARNAKFWMSANTRTLLLAPLTSFWFHAGVFFSFLCIWDVAHLNCHPLLPIFNHFHPFSIPHIELSPVWGPEKGVM